MHAHTHHSVPSESSIYCMCALCTNTHVFYPMHAGSNVHTHPFQKKQTTVGSSLFLTKNYMSFNVITGLTRTDSLCLLLRAGPPWERQTDRNMHRVFVQSLMTTAHPFHNNPFIFVHSWERDKEAESWMRYVYSMRSGGAMGNERSRQWLSGGQGRERF